VLSDSQQDAHFAQNHRLLLYYFFLETCGRRFDERGAANGSCRAAKLSPYGGPPSLLTGGIELNHLGSLETCGVICDNELAAELIPL